MKYFQGGQDWVTESANFIYGEILRAKNDFYAEEISTNNEPVITIYCGTKHFKAINMAGSEGKRTDLGFEFCGAIAHHVISSGELYFDITVRPKFDTRTKTN